MYLTCRHALNCSIPAAMLLFTACLPCKLLLECTCHVHDSVSPKLLLAGFSVYLSGTLLLECTWQAGCKLEHACRYTLIRVCHVHRQVCKSGHAQTCAEPHAQVTEFKGMFKFMHTCAQKHAKTFSVRLHQHIVCPDVKKKAGFLATQAPGLVRTEQ